MCGIFGYFDRGGLELPEDTLKRMGEVIRYRGPDDVGIYAEAGRAVGNRRLSIIDLAHGHQPFMSDDGQIAIVQNGEIFNFVELADELKSRGIHLRTGSDTEVLLRLYENEGLDFLPKLNGMFAIAILDSNLGVLHLVRDRIGVKPLYIHDDGQKLLFGSEIKCLLEGGVAPRLDMAALDSYLTFNYVAPPLTAFKGVRHLPPGHVMTVSVGGVNSYEWWSLASQRPDTSMCEQEWIGQFMDVLDDAVRLRMRADVPFGAFLSGGVDSSSVVGLMQKHASEPVRTYSIGFHEPAYDESEFAQMAAERFHTRHTMERVDSRLVDLWPMAIRHCDQPHGDISFIPTFQVAELAAREVKVVLTGDGADELFAGYDKYRSFFALQDTSGLTGEDFARRYFPTLCLFSEAEKSALYKPDIAASIDCDAPLRQVMDICNRFSGHDSINLALLLDTTLLLPGNNLVKPDRMGMAVSLEARTPFLDYRMMELAFRMPGALKLQGGQTKHLYKKAVAPLIGDTLAYRKKQMFTVPVGEWFRSSLYEFCREMLLGDKARTRDLFKTDVIYTMLSNHRAGTANHTREIRALIALELWMREFDVVL